MSAIKPLESSALYRHCDPALLGFVDTAELDATQETLGQQRAIAALGFGIDIRRPGYNLFVLGNPGSGRHALVRSMLSTQARGEAAPLDWCYVNNFADAYKPRLLRLPAGRGSQFKQDMHRFVSELPQAIVAGFETDDYSHQIDAIRSELKEKEKKALQALGQASLNDRIVLLRTPDGFVFAPMKGEEAMEPSEFAALPQAEQERLHQLVTGYGARLAGLMQQFPRWRRETQERVKTVSRKTMGLAVGHLIEELKEQYADLPDVLQYLDHVMADVVEVGESLREQPKADGESGETAMGGSVSVGRYQVNLLVDNGASQGAPVVIEDNPTFANLVGRIDHMAHMGTLVTDFTLVKPGALHRANGGYLVLDALKVLTQPYAWEGLKRALRSTQVRIESLGQVFGWGNSLPMEPQAVPLAVKVVLVGERRVYYQLKQLDPEFTDLFKVAVDFENDLSRDAANTRQYARFVATVARTEGLLSFERDAVARVIEQAARLAGDSEKLSTDRRPVADLLFEADHHARTANRRSVSREDVEAALAGQVARADRLRGSVHEQILRDNLLIAVEGCQVGQVNGLAVIDLGDFRFAHPVRITATARLGDGEVLDIEREAELGGAIHSKGVMILASFLGARYAAERPLSLSASLVFEQSYGPVEGDSASLAELCALLSTLAGAAIRQSLAITGSVNQHGQVQAIGGVNEKIEGFFDICRARGFNGEQGVLIPAANVKHLMLRADVVEACRAGQFRVFAVSTVDEAVELLTGMPAGAADAQGELAAGTLNRLVADKLARFSALRKAFGAVARGAAQDAAGSGAGPTGSAPT